MSKTKVYYKAKKVTIQVPMCPKCHKEVEVPKNKDFQTIATYRCPSCGYTE